MTGEEMTVAELRADMDAQERRFQQNLRLLEQWDVTLLQLFDYRQSVMCKREPGPSDRRAFEVFCSLFGVENDPKGALRFLSILDDREPVVPPRSRPVYLVRH